MTGRFGDICGQRKKVGAYEVMPKMWTSESEGTELESSFIDSYRYFIILFSSISSFLQ